MAIIRKAYTKPLPANASISVIDGQRYASWIDPHGRKRKAKVTTGRDGSARIIMEVATLMVKFRDASGIVREVSSGCRTKTAAESVQASLRQRTELVRAGVLTRDESTAATHACKPLVEHIETYIGHLSLAASPTHVSCVRQKLERVITDCGFTRLVDLQADVLERWLLLHRREGMGARNANTFLAAWRAFSSWCVEGGRLATNPFSRVPKADEKADRRHPRRALTVDEMHRLLAVARLRPIAEYGREVTRIEPREGKRSNWRRAPLTYDTLTEAVRRGREALSNSPHVLDRLEWSGRERELIYKTLLLTGLRKGELASITVGRISLDTRPATMELKAADEKNRKGCVIPIRNDLADELQAYLSERSSTVRVEPDSPLFVVPAGLVRILDRDLAAAGIPKRDTSGRVVDVHAMRHTFGTHLCRAGVPLRTAQAAMRHSDPKLTANVYTDPVLLDVAGAVDALPGLSVTQPQPTRGRAERAEVA